MKKIEWKEKNKDTLVDISKKFWLDLSEKAYPLSRGSIRVPISLEPFAISKQRNIKLQNDISHVLSAVKKITDAYFKDEVLRKMISVDPSESELILKSEKMPLMGVIRVDLLYGKNPKIVEINADFPDGLFMHDISSEHIQKINGKNLKWVSNIKPFVKLLKAHKVKPVDSIFIGHNKNRKFLDEFELTKIKLNSLGFKNVTVGAFEDLEFSNNTFYYKGERIDVIRRGSELSKLRSIPNFIQNIILAESNNTVKVVNNFKMRLLGHKSLLAVLHHSNYSNLFTTSELKAIQSLIPITQKLEDSNLKNILLNKDHWVLKPSDLAEGDGVILGSSVTKKVWKEKLDIASLDIGKWILQEKVVLPQEGFSVVDENEIRKSNAYYDLCPHVFLTEKETIFGNILVRFSSSEILNIMKGGGLTYLFEENR